ncbi:hypothetical protein HELRODRAFT_175185 [Helobdella robusta]|uniref:Beta-lactamase-related domain-containing protein n=1 Tax=Helobdella robusta TaxID=6412 RepID=T1F8Z2_HELRO|nr:hypothetical protein HELRODRAFT_175185 [Helobdella robusta]ESO01155.1 hypothetical protein HELRODRAFT_175185 [Helobdella robusta]
MMELKSESDRHRISTAIEKCKKVIIGLQQLHKIPGVSISVSVNGSLVWTEGFGHSDVENNTLCTENTVMKIASISKCITSALMANEIDKGRLDLDANINQYLDWPELFYNEKSVFITPRMLACHLAGIRAYKYNSELTAEEPNYRYDEYHIVENYPNVTSALQLFKRDELISEPGSKFNYSNHGYTLLSAVLEKSSKMEFKEMLFRMHYKLVNDKPVICPQTSSSFKIAGAGLLSTSVDLIRFANYIISCYRGKNKTPGGLSKEIVRTLWTPVKNGILVNNINFQYGLGWQVNWKKGNDRMYVGHTGRATGASSVLMISLPFNRGKFSNPDSSKGNSLAVVILSNMQGVSLNDVSINILDIFSQAIDG